MPAPATPRHLRASDLTHLRETLVDLARACDRQMDAASADLRALRRGGDLDEPAVQEPLMAALQSLDTAERSAREVSEALARMDAGTYGVCTRCGAEIPFERLELRPFERLCHGCPS